MTKHYSVLLEVLIEANDADQARSIALENICIVYGLDKENLKGIYEKHLYAGDGSVICMDDLISKEVSHESQHLGNSDCFKLEKDFLICTSW